RAVLLLARVSACRRLALCRESGGSALPHAVPPAREAAEAAASQGPAARRTARIRAERADARGSRRRGRAARKDDAGAELAEPGRYRQVRERRPDRDEACRRALA